MSERSTNPTTDERLTWMLRVLGDEFGGLGVIRAAYRAWPDAGNLNDLTRRIAATDPRRQQPAPSEATEKESGDE